MHLITGSAEDVEEVTVEAKVVAKAEVTVAEDVVAGKTGAGIKDRKIPYPPKALSECF